MAAWDRGKVDDLRRSKADITAAVDALKLRRRGLVCDCPWGGGERCCRIVQGADGFWRLGCDGCKRVGDVVDLWATLRGVSVGRMIQDIQTGRRPKSFRRPPKKRRKTKRKPVRPPWSDALVNAERHLDSIARQE